jgi:hypothetical protein
MKSVLLKRCSLFILISLPPDLCLHYLLCTNGSTRILLLALLLTFINGVGIIFGILLFPNPVASDPKAVRVLN